MWDQIAFVSSGITLVAFVAAAGVYSYRSKLHHQFRLIESATEADRAQIVENTLEFFAVDTSGLSKQQRYEIAIQQIRSKERRYLITAILILSLSLVSAGVVVAAILMEKRNTDPLTIEVLPASGETVPTVPKLMLADDSRWDKTHLHSLSEVQTPHNEEKWVLVVHLSATFLKDKFNRRIYHEGMSEILINTSETEPSTTTSLDSASYEIEPDDAVSEGGLDGSKQDRVGLSRWTLYLIFSNQPPESELISFLTGPRKWEIQVGSHKWTEFSAQTWDERTVKWHVGQAALHLGVEDPDWIVASGARLLKRLDGKGCLIEVNIENLSHDSGSIAEVLLRATRYTHDGSAGIVGPNWREVVLDWASAAELPNGDNTIEAWTMIEEAKVQVTASFRPGTMRGYNDELGVNIPLQFDLTSGESKRLVLAVTDNLPTSAASFRSRDLSFTRSTASLSLANWNKVSVIFSPKCKVFPAVSTVELPRNVSVLESMEVDRSSKE